MSKTAELYDNELMELREGRNIRDLKIHKLQRNLELLVAFACAGAGKPTSETKEAIREYLQRNNGYNEEL